MPTPTPNQQKAISARGNVLVVAGAGAGKTRTLVERCLAFLLDEKNPGSLDEILMVTFTEAAAAEMRKRIRENLEKQFAETPENLHLAEQLALLDGARICTLHSFCFQLVREHFYDLELDPQISILPEEQGELLARDVLDTLMQEIYENENPIAAAVQQLVSEHARGWDKPIRDLVRKVHAYTQTLPNPEGWFAAQLSFFNETQPQLWEKWLNEELVRWKNWWLPVLRAQDEINVPAKLCEKALLNLPGNFSRAEAAEILSQILASDCEDLWPKRKRTICREPIEKLFDEAEFFSSLCAVQNGIDPLAQDWDWARPQIKALLQLAEEFARNFRQVKRDRAAIDFHDLEQLALELLWNRTEKKPTNTALRWREKFRMVLVDEYQDINEAQDTILNSVSRENENANRFLVGDVKQSIYRFRLANPRIFLNYEKLWATAPSSEVISLSDNFRSHEAILNFVNPLFTALMKPEIGGVLYDESARLAFGNRVGRSHLTVAEDPALRVELHLRTTGKSDDTIESENSDLESLSSIEKEARLVGLRLLELKNQHTLIWKDGKKVEATWSDMVILLRSKRNKVEAFAKEFSRLNIPLTASRGGFYASLEVADILNLLRLLDNPLQDLPLLAVLRSPFVGLSLDELAAIRIVQRKSPFWTAMQCWRDENSKTETSAKTFQKLGRFLNFFETWRHSKKQCSLSNLVEIILDETNYADWLLAQERGEQRRANVERLLELTRQFDSLQGEGLFRFIRFIESQQDAEIDLEPASGDVADAVRLMTIHQSKGLEFPIVVVADLGKGFNFSDTKGKVLLDEVYGICPQVFPPGTRQSYPSLPHWISQRRLRIETLGEEIRLLYVALTRAVEHLILSGTIGKKAVSKKWPKLAERGLDIQEISSANHYLDWIGPWLVQNNSLEVSGQNALLSLTLYDENDARLSIETAETETAVPTEQPTISTEAICELQTRIAFEYRFSKAISEPAKTSVSALRRAAETDDDARPFLRFRRKTKTSSRDSKQLSANEIGTAHHTFLEFVSLGKVLGESELRNEAERLRACDVLNSAEIDALDFEGIAAFWNSKIGEKILKKSNHVRREHPFTLRLNAKKFPVTESEGASLEGEFVVLQGVIDIAVILPNEIWLLDFKTDQIETAELEKRAEHYRMQIELYADALEKIYKRPVTERWLHFLAVNQTVAVPPQQ